MYAIYLMVKLTNRFLYGKCGINNGKLGLGAAKSPVYCNR